MNAHVSLNLLNELRKRDKMGLYVRKLASGVCKQQRRRPACTSAQSDQRFCNSFFLRVSSEILLQVKFQFSS